MASSPRPFQRDERKYKHNIFKKTRNYNKPKNKQEAFYENFALWVSFYRANPHRFVNDYLGLPFKLKIFQQILLYMMFHNHFFAYIASRG